MTSQSVTEEGSFRVSGAVGNGFKNDKMTIWSLRDLGINNRREYIRRKGQMESESGQTHR